MSRYPDASNAGRAKGVHLICPSCQKPHIDEGSFALRPHKTHRCVEDGKGPGCGHEWESSRRCVSVEPGRIPAEIEKTFICPLHSMPEVDRLERALTLIAGFTKEGGMVMAFSRYRNPMYDRGKERTSFRFRVVYHGTVPDPKAGKDERP